MKTKTLEGTGKHHLDSESKASIRRGRTAAQWLLIGHLRRRKYDGAHALDESAFNQLKASDLRAGEGRPSEFTMLRNDRLELGNRKPLLEAAQVEKRMGLSLGALQAVIRTPGDGPKLLCFDRSTFDEHGDRTPKYLVVTEDQIDQIRQSEATGFPSRESIKQQIISLKPGQRSAISDENPMPGRALKPKTALLADVDRLADPSLAGQTLLGVTDLTPYPILYVHDLGSAEGTIVEHNSEHITARDPWPQAPPTPVY